VHGRRRGATTSLPPSFRRPRDLRDRREWTQGRQRLRMAAGRPGSTRAEREGSAPNTSSSAETVARSERRRDRCGAATRACGS
jgi:hypothetical protein